MFTNPDPIAFSLAGFDIRWYGIIMATAILSSFMVVKRQMDAKGYHDDLVYDLALWVIPTAILGARMWYVLFNLDYYSSDWIQAFNIRGGGMAIHGGVIGGVLAGWIFCKVKKCPFFEFADYVAPALILGQAIGRWGNYMNGEAHGGPTDLPWAMVIEGISVHPTFLYESIWNLIGFALLWHNREKYGGKGLIFAAYMVFYSIGRFFIEGLRTDSLMVGPFRTAQLVSLTMMVLGTVYIWYARRSEKTI